MEVHLSRIGDKYKVILLESEQQTLHKAIERNSIHSEQSLKEAGKQYETA